MTAQSGRLAFLGEFSRPDGELVVLGKVEKVRGLQGEVAFHPLSRQPQAFLQYRAVRIGNERQCFSQPLVVASSRVIKDAVAFRLAAIDCRDQAEQLLGRAIAVDTADLPALADDEYYWREIVGFDVYDASMEYVGEVKSLFDNGAHDVLVVAGAKGEEILLPMVPGIIRRAVVAGTRQALVVESVAGLFDANRGNK
jgi:16S rRNA processing protein RimM